MFGMFGPEGTHFLNYVRSIHVAHDGSRWDFGTSGTPQPFERPEAYTARRVRDRFTSEMLEEYCKALGIDVFNPEFYGPNAVLVDSLVRMPARPIVMSLAQAQEWLEIRPALSESDQPS